jgi:hemolysin activation/secretion protein
MLAVNAWAQSSQDIEAAQRRAQQIQQEQALQLKSQNESAPKAPQGADLTRAVPEAVAPKLEGAPCIQVNQLTVQGDRWLSLGTMTRLREKYVGTCVGQSELQALMGAMTQDFFQQGLITTRVYLPEQDTQGTLTFKVIEGRIEAYELDDDIKTWNIFPGKAGDVLNLRDIEQGLD